nr:hypothetical protein [Tanacetum cinerariifolium]
MYDQALSVFLGVKSNQSDTITAASTIITAIDVPIPPAIIVAAPTLTAAPSRRKKGVTEAQARKNMMIYLKNIVGFKMDYFKGMSYDDIHPIIEKHFDLNVAFLQKTKEQMDEEHSKALKRMNEKDTPLALKLPVVDYEIYNENNKPYYKIKRVDGLQQLYLSFLSLLRNFDREDLEALWRLEDPPEVPMADNQTMAQLLQAPTVGYEDAIFFGNDKEDPHAHIRYFNKITSTMRVPNVPNSTIKLMLFLFSLEGAVQIWLEKEPPQSILTWDDLVSKFINQFFPPSKTTNLRNEITRFQQRFDESFSEAWDCFNDLLMACPHHGFSELHQLDTLHNALNVNDQDSLNSAAGGNFLDKMPSDCLKIIESKSKVRQSRAKAVIAKVNSSSSTPSISSDVAELKDMVRALLLDNKNQSSAPAPSPTPAPIKAVESNCVTCGANYNQGNTNFRPQMVANQIRPPGFPLVQNNQNNFNRGNNFTQNREVLRNIQSQGQSTQNQCQNIQNQYQTVQNQLANLTDMMSKFMSSNMASSSRSGTLLGNIITNPKEDLNGITTRSGVAYQGPTIPTPFKVVKQGTEVTKDQVQTPSSQSTTHVQPPVTQSETPVSEPVVVPVSAPMPNLKSLIPYPSRRDNKRCREQANEQIEKFYEIFKDMSFEISFTDALILMPKFASTLKALIRNKEKLRMDECLALADLGASINLMPLSVWKGLSLTELTPTCMTLELADRSVSKPIGITKVVSVKVGMFHFPADFVVVDFEPDPRVPLILGRCFLKTGRALIDVYKGESTLRIGNEAITYSLDQTSRYSANYDQMTANKIDVTDEACEEYFQEVFGFSDVTASGSPTPSDDLIVSTTSPTLTPFGDSDFLLFEEANAFLNLILPTMTRRETFKCLKLF